MNFIDWIMWAVMLASVLIGVWRGLVWEVMSILGWVLALWLAPKFSDTVAPFLNVLGNSGQLRTAVAYALVFIAVLILWALLSNLFKKLVSAVGLRPIDRSLGALFGLLRGGLILLLTVVIAKITPLAASSAWSASPTAQLCTNALAAIKPLLPQALLPYI